MIQFAPDLDPITPGIFTDCENIVPTVKGYAGSNTGIATSYSALSAECRNLVIVRRLDNSRRFFATTQTKIYEGSGGSWTAREAGTPDIGSGTRWALAQFGDYTLAVAKAVNLQASTTAAFSTVATAPKATCMATGQGFVMVADTNEGTYGDSPDRWWCSGLNDHTVWTPSVTTQCTTGRLVDTPGPITGLAGYGAMFVAFKENSMYMATYSGAPTVFTWQLIPGEVGCRSKDAIIQAGPQIYFLGTDNFYTFDGSRPVPIGNPLQEWFFNTEAEPLYLYKTVAAYDRTNQTVWFFYVALGETTITRALAYHIPTSKWGKVHLSVEAAAVYLSDSVTIDGLDTYYATIDDGDDIGIDSPFWNSQSQSLAYADTSHVVKTLTGNSSTSSFTTGAAGDPQAFSTITTIRPRFTLAPTSASLQHQYDNDYGDTWNNGATGTLANGKFDMLFSARWHRGIVVLYGPWEMVDFRVYTATDGEE